MTPFICRSRLYLAAGHRTDDAKWLGAVPDCIRQRGIVRVVREILTAGEEADERPSPPTAMLPNRAPQGRIRFLDTIQNRTDRRVRARINCDFTGNPGQIS
jgi:hypothetical protein